MSSPSIENRASAEQENSIRPSRRRAAARSEPSERITPPIANQPPQAKLALEPKADRFIVPAEIRERFVAVKNQYYFPDGARAFTDRGHKLMTPSENAEVIRSLVTIARARGWSEITVRGTERFRKEAWFAARLAGVDVRGYKASEFEQGHLVRTLVRKQGVSAAADAASTPELPKDKDDRNTVREPRSGLLTGKLLDHGSAPYKHDPHEPMSYFVKLETPRGERTLWGVDLERAFKESLTKPQMGDEVGLRAVRQDAVKVKTPKRNEAGAVVGETELETHRNRWIVEKRDFFDARADAARTLRDASVDPKQAVKKHPELVGTYLQVHAADLAARRFRDPEDQRQFVAKVRSALADSVARGEPLPPVRLKERAAGQNVAPRSKETRAREPIVRG